MENRNNYSILKTGIITGILFLLAGTLLLIIKLGIVPEGVDRIFFSWPMLLMVIGILSMVYRHFINGSILFAVGAFFLIPRIAYAFPGFLPQVGPGFASSYWPVLLVIAGFIFIIYAIFRPKLQPKPYTPKSHSKHRHHKPHDGSGNFSRSSVFGEGEHIILDPEFQGGEVNAVFGSITLDLRKSSLPEGNTYLQANSVFGNVTVYVPETWNIELYVDTVLGNFYDKRSNQQSNDSSKKLIIKGSCVFGGGELRN